MSKTLILSVTIVVVSLGITIFAPLNEWVRGVTIIPAVAALLAASWKLFLDHLAHARNLQLIDKEQHFTLGASSHMANTVFDKHVEFCEKYLQEVHEVVVTLMREGPTEGALKHASELYNLRIQYTAWILPEIDEKLEPFEKALRKIGANSGLVKSLGRSLGEGDFPDEEQRNTNADLRRKAVAEMYDTFKSLMDLNDVSTKDAEATVRAVKGRVRDILQIRELIDIRTKLISSVSKSFH